MAKIKNAEEAIMVALLFVPDEKFDFVQIQKTLFLMNDQIGKLTGLDKIFNFVPRSLGPLDETIYDTLQTMEDKGLIWILNKEDRSRTSYALSNKGRITGEEIAKTLPDNVQKYARYLVNWVSDCTFEQLLGAIFAKYPEMEEKSVFAR